MAQYAGAPHCYSNVHGTPNNVDLGFSVQWPSDAEVLPAPNTRKFQKEVKQCEIANSMTVTGKASAPPTNRSGSVDAEDDNRSTNDIGNSQEAITTSKPTSYYLLMAKMPLTSRAKGVTVQRIAMPGYPRPMIRAKTQWPSKMYRQLPGTKGYSGAAKD
jgi:hypothetical protein